MGKCEKLLCLQPFLVARGEVDKKIISVHSGVSPSLHWYHSSFTKSEFLLRFSINAKDIRVANKHRFGP